MKGKMLAIVAATTFAVAGLAAPVAAATEAEIQACVDEATQILLNDPRYRYFRWVIKLGYWDAVLRDSCERTLG